jgi:prepilin-type N-terminal cleavage/methylation domain-containing protein
VKTLQKGFTLVEAMVGITIFAIISLVMAGTFVVGYRTVSNEARIIAADTAVSEASLTLVRDLNSSATLSAGTINGGTTYTLTYGSPAVTIIYSVDAGRNLIRTVNGTARVAARGITSVGIAVAGCYATVTIQPSAAGAAAAILNVSNRPGGCL